MTKELKEPTALELNTLVRWKDGPKYFGYKRSVLNDKINSGEIPKPMSLSDDGRATGWLFRTIREWQEARAAAPRRLRKRKPKKQSAQAAA